MSDISRRFFIGGATAFGAFGGNRFFEAVAGTIPTKKPNLRFGVVSDVHIRWVGADQPMDGFRNYRTFKHALEWFRNQGVDAVMITGDLTDFGTVQQMKAVAQAWYEVFPNDKAPDGRRVEKVFSMGDHDFCGCHYQDHSQTRHKQEAPNRDFADWCRDELMSGDLVRHWRDVFHEDYAPLQVKNVKGYTFLANQWDHEKGLSLPLRWFGRIPFGERLQAYFDKHGKSLDPKMPFFYGQHPHPKGTCFGKWAWGADNGKSTAALSAYANAIAFSGHSHSSLTDEQSVWQGAFTSVNAGSLCYTGQPDNQPQPCGFENSSAAKNGDKYDAPKVMRWFNTQDCRQGMLWSVYDDCIVVKRREFLSDMFLGPDWVMPLTTAEDKPFAYAARAKKSKAPQFAKEAQVTLKKVKAKTRKTKKHDSVEKDSIELVFPPALAEKDGRVYGYEVTAYGTGGKTADFNVVAEGFNQALTHKRAMANSSIVISCDRLPEGTTYFTVKPYDCWWNKGSAISVKM